MTTYVITAEMEILFGEYLEQDEKSKNTIEKYRRDLRKFVEYIDGEEVTKELVIGFKEYLVEHYAVNSVNSIIASLNRFMQFAGLSLFPDKAQLLRESKPVTGLFVCCTVLSVQLQSFRACLASGIAKQLLW